MARVSTGIEGFDALVSGGFPMDASVVVQGPPGQEKLSFALTFLAEGLKHGGSGLAVVASQSPDALLATLRTFGVDVDAAIREHRLSVVDWYSWGEQTVVDVEAQGAIVRSSVDLANAGAAVSRAIAFLEGVGPKRAVIEMLSPAMNVYDLTQVYAFAQSTKRKLDRFHFTALFLLEKEMHNAAALTTLHQPFDGVVEMERVREDDRIVRKIGILHMKDTRPVSDFIPFEFTEEGIRVGLTRSAPPAAPPRQAAPAPPLGGPTRTSPAPAPTPASSGPAPEEPGGSRVRLILEIARERLKVDPEDRDALFSLAAALATADDPRGAIHALERLETVDPDYPGLYALEMKLFALLGDSERWQRSRRKSLEAAARPGTEGTTPCPFCRELVAPGSAQCPHCMSDLQEDTDLFRGLEDLVRATVQEIVQEELAGHAETPPAKPGIAPVSPAPAATVRCPSCAASVPSDAVRCPKCQSNLREDTELLRSLEDLVRETVHEELEPKPEELAPPAPAPARTRREPSPAPPKPVAPEKGLTNGLILKRRSARPATSAEAGRTNGLTNGLRGRTNGLTNGLGRTNGLTNGLRGRTNGLTNGLGGRTNGLTNGLRGRTNGLTNGLGRTNGLTNGVGRTNGLTNGLAKVAQSRGVFAGRGRARWQRIGLAAALVALILVLPVVFFWSGPTVTYPIRVDGQFGDWAGITKVAALPPQVTPNPDIEISHVALKDNLDSLAFYLQVQGNATAGGPTPLRITNTFYAFIDADRSYATGYQVQGIGADRMVRISTWGGQIVAASLMDFDPGHGHQDWNGWVSAGSVEAAAAGGEMEFQVPWLDLSVARGPVNVAFASRGWEGQSDAADVVVTNANPFLLVSQDTAAPSVITSSTTDLSRFSFRAVDGDMAIRGLNVTLEGTFGVSAVSAVDLVDDTGNVLSELASAPTVNFDVGSFPVSKDQTRTLAVRLKMPSPDGSTIGALLMNLNDVRVVSGGVAFSAPIPKPRSLAYVGMLPAGPRIDGAFGEWTRVAPSPPGNAQPVWDQDVDLSGYAFMAAGNSTYFMATTTGTTLNGTMIPELNSAYVPPPGNTTGNGTTPPPYVPPPVNGTDSLRIFVDADGSATTGYAMGALGADYLVEVTGKNGLMISSQAMRFAGTNPSDWNWTRIGNAPAAKDLSHVEVALPGLVASNVTRAVFEITGWNGAHDGSNAALPASISAIPGVMYSPGAISGVDPTGIIDTSTALTATGGPIQRNLFYDGANFWAFYYDGTTVQYEPSSDGLSWVNTKNAAFTTTTIPTVSTWFNWSGSAKNVYVVGDTGLNSKSVDVRQGTISGTTITWAASDVAVTISANQPGNGATKAPTIVKDSSGYLWIAGFDKAGSGAFNFAAARSTNADSVAAWNAVQVMNITNSSSSAVQGVLVPLPTGGQVYAIWYLNGPIYGRLYTGTAWSGTVDSIATAGSGNQTLGPSAVADASGNIHLVYVDSSGGVQYKKRTGSSWGSATALDSSAGNWYPTITRNNSTGNLTVFWISNGAQIKAKVFSGGSWASASLEANTNGKAALTSMYNVATTPNVAWAWTQKYCQAGSTACFDVKASVYNTTLSSRTIDTAADTSALSYNNQRKVFFDGTYTWTFYFDGTSTVYTYSNSTVQGWENPVLQAFTSTNIGNPSVWYYPGATKVVYVVGDAVAGGTQKYVNVRRGVISGTTITWGTEATVSVSTTAILGKVPFIARDANGYLWIVSNIQHSGGGANLNVCAIRSTNPDNVSAWAASCNPATGLLAADIANNFLYSTVLPLSGGDMYALWYADGAIAGRQYTSANSTWWNTIESIASTTASVKTKIPSAVVDSSNYVDLVYIDSSGAVQFKQRTSVWGSATSLDVAGGSKSPTITLEQGTNYLDVFYLSSSNQIKGQYYSGSWSAITGYIDTSTTNKTYLSSIYSVTTRGLVMWMWGAGTTTPLEIRIARIAIPEFSDIALPIATTLGTLAVLARWRRRRGAGSTGATDAPGPP